MLKKFKGTVIIVGENDMKPDGRHPGLEGAKSIAEKLRFWELAAQGRSIENIKTLMEIRPALFDCMVGILTQLGLIALSLNGQVTLSNLAHRTFVQRGPSPHIRPALHFFEFIRHHLGEMEAIARGDPKDLPMGWPPRSEAEE